MKPGPGEKALVSRICRGGKSRSNSRGALVARWRPRGVDATPRFATPAVSSIEGHRTGRTFAAVQGPARGSWLFSYQLVEPSGHVLSQSDINRVGETIRTSGGSESMSSYFHTHGILATVLYQPADRYWLFQGIEAAIFLTVAVALLALTVGLVRQRAS